MGSLAFIAASRSAYIVVKDKNNKARRLFVPVKNNLVPEIGGLAYTITDEAIAWERRGNQ